MFVAHSHLGEEFPELTSILGKYCRRLLLDFSVGGAHRDDVCRGEVVGIGSVVIRIFATYGEVSLEDGIAEDKFCSPEVIAFLRVAGNLAFGCYARRSRRCFYCTTGRLAIVEESINVEVDAQLSYPNRCSRR